MFLFSFLDLGVFSRPFLSIPGLIFFRSQFSLALKVPFSKHKYNNKNLLIGLKYFMRGSLHLFTDKNGNFFLFFDTGDIGDNLSCFQYGFRCEVQIGQIIKSVGQGLISKLDFLSKLVFIIVLSQVEHICLELVLVLFS